jgi:hypothetical protein
MEPQGNQPLNRSDEVSPTPLATTTQAPPAAVPVQTDKPKLEISDEAAQALLAFNGVQSSQKPKAKLPIGIIITILVLVVLVAVSSTLVGKVGSKGRAKPPTPASTRTPDQSGSNVSQSVGSQVNQDVNQCSNTLDAISEC